MLFPHFMYLCQFQIIEIEKWNLENIYLFIKYSRTKIPAKKQNNKNIIRFLDFDLKIPLKSWLKYNCLISRSYKIMKKKSPDWRHEYFIGFIYWALPFIYEGMKVNRIVKFDSLVASVCTIKWTCIYIMDTSAWRMIGRNSTAAHQNKNMDICEKYMTHCDCCTLFLEIRLSTDVIERSVPTHTRFIHCIWMWNSAIGNGNETVRCWNASVTYTCTHRQIHNANL